MGTVIKFDKEIGRRKFVEAFLSSGTATSAAVESGVCSTEGAHQYLNSPKTLALLRQMLPQRNPDEMCRVYGKMLGYLKEAEERYRKISKVEDESDGKVAPQELDRLRTQSNARFQQLITAADMVGRAAGLHVKVNMAGKGGGEGEPVDIVRKVTIVVNAPTPQAKENVQDAVFKVKNESSSQA